MQQNNYQSPVVSIKILSLKMERRKISSDVSFVMALSGKIIVDLDGMQTVLKQKDVKLICPEDFPVLTGSDNNLVMIITIRKDFFNRNGIASLKNFVCDSVNDTIHDYREIRKLLSQIAISHYGNMNRGNIHQIELCYSLIHHLTTYHRLGKPVTEGVNSVLANRKTAIIEYLEQNYMNAITLTELAEMTHLNSSYLSRFFKKSTGGTFNSFLKNIRLNHAVDDLLNTDKSITSVACENGFATPAAFCKIFVAQFGVTPSQYRRDRESVPEEKMLPDYARDDNISVEYEKVVDELQTIAGDSTVRNSIKTERDNYKRIIVENVTLSSEVSPKCCKLINLGFCMNILKSEYQRHMELAQKEIGFEYGRIECLMNDEVIPQLQNGEYNFTELDKVISTLIDNNIRPYIDLTVRGANVLLPGKDEIYYRFYNTKIYAEDFLNRLEAVVKHCVNYYGYDEVNRWVFDIGIFHNEYLQLRETAKAFAKRAKASAQIIRKYTSQALIGGVAYNSGMAEDAFENIIKEMTEEGFCPDFISTCIFPYDIIGGNDITSRVVSVNPDHVRNELLREKFVLEKYTEITNNIWVVALGVSIQAMDYVNDTCFQAAYFVKNTIDLLGLVDRIGYYQLSDVTLEYYNATGVLFGAPGIISRNGMRKTGFFAIQMLNMLDESVVMADESCIITTNGFNTYHILVSNYIYFNEIYCVSGAKGMTVESAYDSFNDPKSRKVDITLNVLSAGNYKMICESVSRSKGSIFDEWMNYGMLDNLEQGDLKYLGNTAHPRRFVENIECRDGKIEINIDLEPHETRFYEIKRKM